jgi:hypothetical protein
VEMSSTTHLRLGAVAAATLLIISLAGCNMTSAPSKVEAAPPPPGADQSIPVSDVSNAKNAGGGAGGGPPVGQGGQPAMGGPPVGQR